jgi:outer membrane protein assembly factor BamB
MRLYFAIFFICSFLSGSTQELVEFRGEGRCGVYPSVNLLKSWPTNVPKQILKISGFGKGYSQPIFAGGKIFITGIKHDTLDVLSAFDLRGKLLWESVYGRAWIRTYPESRSTPTFFENKIYTLSGTGQLSCFEAETGKFIWKVDASEKYKGEIYKHGEAEAPLVFGKLVVYTTGGEENTMVAINKDTGSLVWKAKSLGGAKSYASPVLINFHGKKIILTQTSKNLIAINAEDGNILWSYDLIQYHKEESGIGAQANPPIYYNGEIFVASGYNHPGLLFTLAPDGNSIKLKWENKDIDTHHGGDVLIDGNLYGANWQDNARGNWVSVNWETGKTNWEQKWINKGSTISADGMLYFFEEKSGNVALVKPSPEKLDIVGTFRISGGDGPYWAHPAIYDGKLFIRHGDVLLIYSVKANESETNS